MREQMKQQIKEMLATLGRGEAILDSRIKKQETGELNQLFEDMQNSAITIGTSIEQVEGEGTETVRLLEEYCELLWQYMVEGELRERFRIARLLAGKRGEIGSSLEAEFKGRLEIVFLVCRNRGWKQMERFYNIMKEQADCYVLTASYMEVSPGTDGTVLHDESGSIPDGVRTAKAFQYDIQERKPDLVFVDGPFAAPGGEGAVPDYDFTEVRENAGMVLYTPCYEDDSQARESHCRISQVIDSDIILVPSRGISDIYINAMKQMDNGRELIKKIYILDALDEGKLLSKAFEKQRL